MAAFADAGADPGFFVYLPQQFPDAVQVGSSLFQVEVAVVEAVGAGGTEVAVFDIHLVGGQVVGKLVQAVGRPGITLRSDHHGGLKTAVREIGTLVEIAFLRLLVVDGLPDLQLVGRFKAIRGFNSLENDIWQVEKLPFQAAVLCRQNKGGAQKERQE